MRNAECGNADSKNARPFRIPYSSYALPPGRNRPSHRHARPSRAMLHGSGPGGDDVSVEWRWAGAVAAATLLGAPLMAQELEPRALQNAPVGTTFVVAATGYSHGNLLVDPALPIEDATADVWSVAAALSRSLDLFGLSGRVGLVAPFLTGTWQGTLAGTDTSTSRTGFADPRVTLAVNVLGAPALTRSQLRGYRQSTVLGMQLAVTVPVGQYYPDRLINIGSHRWSFQPRLGLSHAAGARWVLEAYAGATFFTTNGDFYGGQTADQAPFFDAQAHAIYALRGPAMWVAVSAGYGWGGRATINGDPKEPLSNVRISAMLRLPLAQGHGLKLVYINGLTTKLGTDFDTFQVAYQYAFGGKP